MERTEKTWLLEIIVAAVMAAILAALLGLVGWTAIKVVQVGESVVETRAEIGKVEAELRKEIAEVRVDLQKEIAEVRAELGRDIAVLNAKMDLLITGLNISVAPKESADAAPSGANRSSFRVGAGETATE